MRYGEAITRLGGYGACNPVLCVTYGIAAAAGLADGLAMLAGGVVGRGVLTVDGVIIPQTLARAIQSR